MYKLEMIEVEVNTEGSSQNIFKSAEKRKKKKKYLFQWKVPPRDKINHSQADLVTQKMHAAWLSRPTGPFILHHQSCSSFYIPVSRIFKYHL